MHIFLCLAPQQFSDQIVGFVPRKHVTTAGGVYSYGSFELQDPEIAGGDRSVVLFILLHPHPIPNVCIADTMFCQPGILSPLVLL